MLQEDYSDLSTMSFSSVFAFNFYLIPSFEFENQADCRHGISPALTVRWFPLLTHVSKQQDGGTRAQIERCQAFRCTGKSGRWEDITELFGNSRSQTKLLLLITEMSFLTHFRSK